MKKWLVLVLSIVALITLSACAEQTPELDVSLSRQSVTINVSQTTPLSTFIQGELEGLTYHFTNPQVARVQGSNLEALEAGFSTLTVRTSNDQLVGRIEVIVPSPTPQSPGDEDPVDEDPTVNPLVLALEASDNDVLTVYGYVSVILGQAFFLQNEDVGMYVFLGSNATLGAIQVGNSVRFEATRTTFNQRPQLSMPTNIEAVSLTSGVPTAASKSTLAQINRGLEGQIIRTPELFVKTIPSSLPSGGFSVVLSDGLTDVTMFVEATQTERKAIFEALSSVPAGHSIQLSQVAVSSFANNVQLALGAANAIVTAPASETFLSRAIGQSVTLPVEVSENITLPSSVTVLGQSFSVSWVTSDGNIVSSNGTVTRPALSVGDQEVLLGGIFSGPGITINRFFEITVISRDTDDPIEPEPTEPGTPGEAVTITETFNGVDNFGYTPSGTIQGTSGIEWTFVDMSKGSDDEGDFVQLRPNAPMSTLSSSISGGLVELSITAQAFGGNRSFDIIINEGQASEITLTVSGLGATLQTFDFTGLAIEGNFTIKITNFSNPVKIYGIVLN